ncbi:MAG: hypothetical protein H6999_04190 [Hahellaceae bacterium]|nr:hypothetical protein [Hahellaceae bacterium]MCP5168937.1 hypothetical protein [Hahellaceae bacterium]
MHLNSIRAGLMCLFCPALSVAADAVTPSVFDHWTATHKLTLEATYLESDTLNPTQSLSHSVKYEGYFRYFNGDENWPDWEVMLRPWLVSAAEDRQFQLFSTGGTQFEGEYVELREFYYQHNRVFGDPAYTLRIGRQQYQGDYGLWWDDSIESVSLAFDETNIGGFIALGQKFHSYNVGLDGDVNELSAAERDIFYVFGEFWKEPRAGLRYGVRTVYQYDVSAPNDNSDLSDFHGVKLGGFIQQKNPDQSPGFDYYLDAAVLTGKHQHVNSGGLINDTVNTFGWQVLGEVGYSFAQPVSRDRLAFRLGVTDSPDSRFGGSKLLEIQSDRVTNNGRYSTSLAGSFLDIRFSNILFAGATYRRFVSARNSIEVMVFDLYQRNKDLPLSASIGDRYDNGLDTGEGDHIGQLVDVFYSGRIFPYAYEQKRITFDYLASAGYFHNENAIGRSVNDYQVSIGINIRY